MSNLNRRDLLRWSLAASVATLPTAAIAQPVGKNRVLRIAHLTDAHVQPEHGAADGLRACFRHAQASHKPDLIVAGGDQIMDALAKPAASMGPLISQRNNAPDVSLTKVEAGLLQWGR